MPQIISCSRRSDVPALHARWLMARLRAGFCEIVNPFNSTQVERVSLQRDSVAAIVFWTRWPRPLRCHLDEIEDRCGPALWLVTITGYPRQLDPRTPPWQRAAEEVQRLAADRGPRPIHWRYDPIVVSSLTPLSFHEDSFGRIAERLAGATAVCHLSFVDVDYRKTARRLADLARTGVRVEAVDIDEQRALGRRLAAIGARLGIDVVSCCEPALFIRPAGCIDVGWVRSVTGDRDLVALPRPTRPGCLCSASKDIGAYDTCSLGCIYCYATRSDQAGRDGRRRVDASSASLWPGPKNPVSD
ncbi:MAG: DUF1848 domain-containing protein [Deltaproteobacteria bacterium]|nr:DUF1848 domain-containing protein [Deltaproteobacteria bacterium]